MKRKILFTLLALFIIIQFIRPSKNLNKTIDATHLIQAKLNTPDNINVILQKSCNDCHSNNSVYPWYSNIQPVYWYLNHHINEGKHHFNFDEFGTYKLAKQYHKLEEVIEQVETNEMPMSSYTLIHSNAKLSTQEKTELIKWAKACLDTMKAIYPADSLIRKKK